MKPFGELVSRSIPKLVNLQEYSLSLGGPHFGRSEPIFGPMWLPDNASFQLRRLSVDFNLSPAMVKFLVSQPSIVELFSPYFEHQRGTIPSNALPNLRSIVSNTALASVLVPKRPLRRVALRDGETRRERAMGSLLAALPALARASVSVRQFDTCVFDMASTGESLMEPLQSRLPRLESITLRRHPCMRSTVFPPSEVSLSGDLTLVFGTHSILRMYMHSTLLMRSRNI